MLSKLKEYVWWIVGGIAVLFVIVVLRDANRAEELASFFRIKKVQDDIQPLKDVIAKNEGEVKATDAELAKVAEAHREALGRVKDADEQQVYDFYKDFFKKTNN